MNEAKTRIVDLDLWEGGKKLAEVVKAQAAEIEALRAERDALRADAERYRWLREQEWFDGDLCVLREPKRVLTQGIGLGADCPSHHRLDAAIDAAKEQG